MLMAMSELAPEAKPADLTFTLKWHLDARDGLSGELQATNVSNHRVRVSGKPDLIPLDIHGAALKVQMIVSMELRWPGYVELEPGERATSPVSWAGWDGPPCSGTVIIEWPGGRAPVTAIGPGQPKSRGPVTNLSSSWFSNRE
jgi:hypothetical protein